MASPTGAEIGAAVDALIARQCHAIDGADFETYGDTFTADGIFDNRAVGTVLTSRAEIVQSSKRHATARQASGTRFRHFVFGTTCTQVSATEVLAESTTLIVQTRQGRSEPFVVLRCRDRLRVGPPPPLGAQAAPDVQIMHRTVSRFSTDPI
ncbi:MAG: nuclear transport factor 2 family protein [Dermatophilaceae bacterium]